MQDNCGIVGIRNVKNIGDILYHSLYSLQHRGQESAGVVLTNRNKLISRKTKGLVSGLTKTGVNSLEGFSGIGHVRYSTTKAKDYTPQPLVVPFSKFGSYAVAHNGNITNNDFLRNKLIENGCSFLSASDSEVINQLISSSQNKDFKASIVEALKQIKGAYSLVFLRENGDLIAVKDPQGFRPLCLGILNSSFIVASESCVFDVIGAKFIRELNPGEMLTITENGLESCIIENNICSKFCSFEYIYFARPDSIFYGVTVHEIRELFGMFLAKETGKIDADIVIAVPDSGISAALGFSKESGIPYDRGIIRNHYVGRTFIEPTQFLRNIGVRLKLNMLKVVRNKKVAVVDDSIVRATTSKRIVEALRKTGASKIHMLVSSPPIKSPCFFGIDTPKKEQLIAANLNPKDICNYIGSDSLHYLSIEGLKKAMPLSNNCCTDCFRTTDLNFESRKPQSCRG